MKRATFLLLGLAAAATALHNGAAAQAWPARPVRVIVPHPAGGPGDVPPRGIAQALSQTLGQPVIIENREGADGLIGAEAAAKSAPDGYTFLATSSSAIIMNPMIRKAANYDISMFTPIVHTGTLQQLLLLHPKVPANSMKEVFAMIKAKPESLSVGTFGSINLANVFVEWTKTQGLRFYPVPYKSASQSLRGILAGEVHIVSFAAGPAAKLIAAGKVKPLAISPRRNEKLLPGVPSLREAGVQFDLTTWWGWFAPAGIDRAIVSRLNGEIARLIADPQFNAKFLASQGLATDRDAGDPPAEFEKFIHQEASDLKALMTQLGVKRQ